MNVLPTSRVIAPRQAALLLAVSVAVFGINWPVLKIVLHSITPLWFTTLRMAAAAFLWLVLLGIRGKLIWPTRRDLPMVASLGLFQYGMMSTMIIYGISIVGAGRAAMLVYTSSIWVAIGAILILGEKPSRIQIAGLVCGVTGLAVLFSPFGLDWSNRRILLGNGCVILGAVAWSAALLQVRGHRWHADPIRLMPFQPLIGALVSLPFAIWLEGPVPPIHWGWEFAASFGCVVVLATCFAFWGLVLAGRALPAIAVSLGQLATPVLGVVASALVVAEIPSWADIVGLTLIVCGVGVPVVLGGRSRIRAPISPVEPAG